MKNVLQISLFKTLPQTMRAFSFWTYCLLKCIFCSPLDWANEDLHQFTFIPNLAEFEAMRTKEQTLSELFTELDLDKDGLIGAAELRDFCEDIGQDITLERAAKDIALVDGNKDGKIDKDEWIELMFPKFNIQ